MSTSDTYRNKRKYHKSKIVCGYLSHQGPFAGIVFIPVAVTFVKLKNNWVMIFNVLLFQENSSRRSRNSRFHDVILPGQWTWNGIFAQFCPY